MQQLPIFCRRTTIMKKSTTQHKQPQGLGQQQLPANSCTLEGGAQTVPYARTRACSHTLAEAHLPVAKTTLDGPFDKALQSRSDGLQLLALQLKSHDKNLPADVLSLVRSSHAPVMLFKSRAHAVHSTE
eukprot:365578-Chlamydomonas_euryale.AAC.22